MLLQSSVDQVFDLFVGVSKRALYFATSDQSGVKTLSCFSMEHYNMLLLCIKRVLHGKYHVHNLSLNHVIEKGSTLVIVK